jgi:hypothetical protein
VGTIVIKPERDQDFYVGWSTEVESPDWWGSRAEAKRYLTEDSALPYGDKTDPDERLNRADANGTSAIDGFAFFGAWDYEAFIYEQRGRLLREHLAEACRLLAAEDEPGVWDLLEPLEGETKVRRG